MMGNSLMRKAALFLLPCALLVTWSIAFANDPFDHRGNARACVGPGGGAISFVELGAGSVSSPSLRFALDLDTGLFNPTADTVGIVGGGGAGYFHVGETFGVPFIAFTDETATFNGAIVPNSTIPGQWTLYDDLVGFGYGELALSKGYFLNNAGSSSGVLIDGENDSVGMVSNTDLAWSNSATSLATKDTGLDRTAAGIVGVTDGTTGQGAGFVPGTRTFAALGTPGNGTTVYCSDCTFANPCAGAGTGAIAKRLNGAWRCD